MTSSSKRTPSPPRGPATRASLVTLSTCLALLAASACGGQRADSKTAAEPPQQPQSAPADAESESRAYGQQPAGAAPAPAPESIGGERRQLEIDDIDALSRSLDRSLRLSVPDCSSAASLRDRICDLAQRICDIAARSAESEVAEHCTDGKRRCERATASVRTTCPE